MTVVRETWIDSLRRPVSGHVEFEAPTARYLTTGERLSTTSAVVPLDALGTFSVDVVPGLSIVTAVLGGKRSATVLLRIPDVGPVPLSSLAAQAPVEQTAGVLTLASVGAVVPGFNTAGQVLDRSGVPVATTPATSTALGTVQLAGDLAGTAAAPTVPGLAQRELLVPRAGATAGQVPVLQAGGALAFATPAAPPGFASTAVSASRAGTSQGFTAAPFQTVICSTVISDPGANYNPATSFYTAPSSGLYVESGQVRFDAGGFDCGIGIHTSTADNPNFLWTYVVGTARWALQYTRLQTLVAGDQVRLFLYPEKATAVIQASFSVVRVA